MTNRYDKQKSETNLKKETLKKFRKISAAVTMNKTMQNDSQLKMFPNMNLNLKISSEKQNKT